MSGDYPGLAAISPASYFRASNREQYPLEKMGWKGLVGRDADLGCILYIGKLTNDGHWQIQRSQRIRHSARSGKDHHALITESGGIKSGFSSVVVRAFGCI